MYSTDVLLNCLNSPINTVFLNMYPTYFGDSEKKIGSLVPKKQQQLAEKEKPKKPGSKWKIRYRNELICTITEFKSASGKLSILYLNNLTV